MKTIAEQIQEAQGELVKGKDRIVELSKALSEDNSEINETALTEATEAVEALVKRLGALEKAEKALTLRPVDGPAVVLNVTKSKDTDNLLGQMAAATYIARIKGITIEQVIEHEFNKSKALDMVFKVAQNPAMSNVAGYAQELTETAYGQFIDLLRATAILTRAVPAANSHQFDGFASIVRPMRTGTTTDAHASWRAEGAPIPVRGLSFGSLTLTPKNMGVILTATEEMARRSKAVDLAAFFQNAIAQDTSTYLDQEFVGNTVGSAIRPAGVRNGIPAGDTRPSSGVNPADIMTDLKVMLKAMSTHEMGTSNTYWLMNSSPWYSILLAQTATGTPYFPEARNGILIDKPVIVSNSMPPDVVLLIDFNEISFAIGAPAFEVTNVATLHEDTAPGPISTVGSPNVVAAPVRSLFQTNSWAIRELLDCDWAKLRVGGGMVQELTSVAWE